ncbi:putative crustin-like antimicrobial peptide 7 [Homarus americanus]|uniref:Putative crustin-like antimicrobial peptide 7 n=2 Tax=Homarus americanus TaxID=6706 RepID=A0A8J5JIW9_HOMAM|nr:putative crustin-like antimicrobial peptide 7 [Homarus americanus]
MMKLVLLCVLGVALGQTDTRHFNLGSLVGSVASNIGAGVGINPGVIGGGNLPIGASCRYHCRGVNGYYCCDDKPGYCPPVRPDCPPTRVFAGPQICINDSQCGGSDKCCYDTCLQESVCKPIEGAFFGPGRR